MLRVQLLASDRDALDAVFRPTDDRKLRDLLQIVLMAARGRRPAEIAADLEISSRTVPRWLNACHARGLDGLRPRAAQGAAPKVPAGLADEVKRWVIDGSAACGLDRANWTYAESADRLKLRRVGGACGGHRCCPWLLKFTPLSYCPRTLARLTPPTCSSPRPSTATPPARTCRD